MIIEQSIIEYLNSTLDVPAYGSEPENPNPAENPASFVVVRKTGSGEHNRIRSAMMAIQSYAGTLFKAAELNEAVIQAMENIVALDRVTGVRLNSDYEFTKLSTKQPRYQAVFEIFYY